MPLPSIDPSLKTAIAAVVQAAMVCRHVQSRLTDASGILKPDRSPVTIGDYAAQALVARGLRGSMGTLPLVAEESSDFLRKPEHKAALDGVVEALHESGTWPGATAEEVLGAIATGSPGAGGAASGGSYWTLDPIDGTKGFLRRQQYAVCLARIDAGKATLGVLACPNLSADFGRPFEQPDAHGCLLWATLGGGAWTMPLNQPDAAPVRLTRDGWDEARPPSITLSVEPSHARREELAGLSRALGESRPPAQLDSQCKYAVVARCQADAYFRPARSTSEQVWDHAAGCLLTAEAGCVVSDLDGKELDFSTPSLTRNRGILAAPAALHRRILAALAKG